MKNALRMHVLLKRCCICNTTNAPRRLYHKLTVDSINPNVRKVEYAVRGPIVQRALELEKVLKSGAKKDYEAIIRCNIGDCQFAGQKPIQFIRDVLSVATNTKLMDTALVPEDAKQRAQRFLDSCGGSVGVYSQSTGVEVVREDVARYIEKRDGLPAHSQDIFLSTGASEAVKSLLQLVSTAEAGNQRAGIMIPTPQYPLYSATNSEYNAYQINYFLDESDNWSLNIDNLESALKAAQPNCQPRMLVVINPGNPTGQVLSYDTIAAVLRFAYKHDLFVLADEVYQHNIYIPGGKFVSFKRVLHDLGEPYSTQIQLASVMSCSKGYMGECGLRGGYCELINLDPEVQAQLYKCLSARLCSSLLGQLALNVVVRPPEEGEVSYVSYKRDRDTVLSQLKTKAELVSAALNSLPGFSCNPVMGSMYAFPRMQLPKKAIEAAQVKNVAPDFFYCLNLLEETGVCVVPGSGFGQEPGTWHFRITILPSVEQMKIVMQRLERFHKKFMLKYQ